jgi:MFS family permease
VISTVAALLLASAVLYAGNGLQATLLAVRANAEGFSLTLIGMLMSAYFGGFITGCRFAPRLVMRVGHIRTFTALASIASASALAHALVVDPVSWLLLRAVTGFCFAGLAMIVESWINEKATNQIRGRLLSVYRIVDLLSLTVGQVLLTVASPEGFRLFALVSILVSLALVPVALTTSVAPQPIRRASLDVPRLFEVSPLAALGCLLVGMANTSFWALGPVFVQQLGHPVNLIAVFMSVTIISGALAQWPLGMLSDHMDRRILIVLVAASSGVSGYGLFVSADASVAWLLTSAAAFGLFAIPLYGLCVAHANDHAEPDSYVEVNGGLLMLYGLGAIAGPVVSARAMTLLGPRGLFAAIMAIHVVMVLWSLYRLVAHPAIREEEKEPFVAVSVPGSVPTATQEGFDLDPRVAHEERPPPSAPTGGTSQ